MKAVLTLLGRPWAASFLRLGAWSGIPRNHAHRPRHHLKPHLLKVRALPHGLNVAEAVVEHTPLAVVLRPDDSEIFVGALHAFAREIDLVGVEAEQHTNIPPGEILLEEYLKPLGLGQVQAAERLGISLNRLNEIVLGKRGITADTALRLSRLLKTSPQLWMRLQADWDLHQALERERKRAS